jgi:hypothetical protein
MSEFRIRNWSRVITRPITPRMRKDICLVVMWIGLSSAPAIAQTRLVNSEFRESTVVDESLLRAGRIELGFTAAGAWAFNDTGTAQHTAYVAPALVGGYMATDWLEVRLTLGGLYVGSGIGEEESQDDFSGTLTVQALAQADFGLGVGGYFGLGLGGYYGFANRPADGGVRLRSDHAGGVGQALIGVFLQPGAALMMRGGARLDLLYGAEWPENGGATRSAFNAALMAELGISWRLN